MDPLRVRELMSKPVITVSPVTRLYDVHRLMQFCHLRQIPVVDGFTLVGIVSHSDIGRIWPVETSTRRADVRHAFLATICAEEVMTTAVVTIAADATIAEAAALMVTQRVRSLPVMEGVQLVGMLTEHDLLKLLAGATTDNQATLAANATMR